MRVGVDAHVLDGKYQGSRTWLLELLRRAPALDPDVTFVVYTTDPAAAAALLPDVEHRRLPAAGPVRRNLVDLPLAMRRDRLDLLLTQYFTALTHPSRQVVVVHDVLFETHPQFFPPRTRWRNRLLVRWSARRAGRVLTVSRYSRDQITAAYGVPPDRVAVVHNGVAPADGTAEAELPTAVPRGTRYVLSVGRLEPRKNVRLLLDALDRVRDPAARLVVVGRDDFERPEVLDRLAADPRVVHLVDVPDAQLAALYRYAAALVFPSLGEGWGIPVLEALAAGTPVIASDRTAVPEAGGDVCTYFSPVAPDAAEHLARLVEQAIAGELPFDAEAAAAHVARLGWDAAAVELLDALRTAPGAPRATSRRPG